MMQISLKFFITLVFLINLLCQYSFAGIFTWLFKGQPKISNPQERGRAKTISEDAAKVTVPFEMKSTDEKFLQEVSIQVSELDMCQHRVILALEKSCSDLSEEELSKVAVNLLNCQSLVEERTLFPCTETMLLRDCTSDMDESTWNAYHIISNRVRAVCYNFRQQQFTMKTEMSVNKLMQSTMQQIDVMKILEQSQNVLKEATSDTLSLLSTGHLTLQKQQDQLSNAHLNMRNYVSLNIRELTREKRLIASGQKEIFSIINGIKKKLEAAHHQLKTQGVGQRESHQKILNDLSGIQENAAQVWHQIDHSTQVILDRHEKTMGQYAQLMNDLQKMNHTVHHLMEVLIHMKSKVEEKFSWISSLLGDTDATVQKIYSFILHLCFCLFGMVAAIFLQIPYTTRLALIILVPLNFVAELNGGARLPFSTITVVLGILMFFNLITLGLPKLIRWRKARQKIAICCNTSLSDGITMNSTESNASESKPAKVVSSSDKVSRDSHQNLTSAEFGKISKLSSYMDETSANSSVDFSEPFPCILEDDNLDLTPQCDRNDSISTLNFSASKESPSLDRLRQRIRSVLRTPPNRSFSSVASGEQHLISPLRLSASFTREKKAEESWISHRSEKRICSSICKNGLPCKNSVVRYEAFCYIHIRGVSRENTPI